MFKFAFYWKKKLRRVLMTAPRRSAKTWVAYNRNSKSTKAETKSERRQNEISYVSEQSAGKPRKMWIWILPSALLLNPKTIPSSKIC